MPILVLGLGGFKSFSVGKANQSRFRFEAILNDMYQKSRVFKDVVVGVRSDTRHQRSAKQLFKSRETFSQTAPVRTSVNACILEQAPLRSLKDGK